MNLEYIIYPFIIKSIPSVKTGNIYIDTLLIAILISGFLIYNNRTLSKKIEDNIYDVLFPDDFTSKITFVNEGNTRSMKFNSLIHYLHTNNFKTIKELKERMQYKYNYSDEDYEENYKNSSYDINQTDVFNFTSNILGRITENVKEKKKYKDSNQTEYKDIYKLDVYSDSLSLKELENWINDQYQVYTKYIRTKNSDTQLLLTLSWDQKEKELDVEESEWDSSITFDNSYFHDMNKIKHKIDFFLNNEKWYKERGIPYNLGILLYGEPGCGKTRFIKQLINYTGRHALDIKLNDGFDFDVLRKIIQNEQLNEDYIISQKEKIIVFEDIDAAGNIVKQRQLNKTKKHKKNSDSDSDSDSDSEKNVKSVKVADINSQLLLPLLSQNNSSNNNCDNSNNNLSYFLNILDGLNECSGRIIIMTTNRINYLDKALIRPGRVDIKIEFKKCTIYDVHEMSKLFWKEQYKYTINDIIKDIDNKYTSAEVINIFRSTGTYKDIKNKFIKS